MRFPNVVFNHSRTKKSPDAAALAANPLERDAPELEELDEFGLDERSLNVNGGHGQLLMGGALTPAPDPQRRTLRADVPPEALAEAMPAFGKQPWVRALLRRLARLGAAPSVSSLSRKAGTVGSALTRSIDEERLARARQESCEHIFLVRLRR